MGKKKTTTEIRHETEAAKIAQCLKALTLAKASQKRTQTGTKKRKDTEWLGQFLSMPLRTYHAIREPDDYIARSYNIGRQVIGLIDHLFVQYQPPHFLYRAMLNDEGRRLIFEQIDRGAGPDEVKSFQHWFLVVARGASFAKAASDHLSRREAHWFLLAPHDLSIHQNLFWAKCRAAGASEACARYLVEWFGDTRNQDRVDRRVDDLIRLYAEIYPHLRGYDLQEITDFVLAAVDDPLFSFSGRTIGSLRKLSHEWHRTAYAGHIGVYRSWPQRYGAWHHQTKTVLIRAIELTNNRALADEGKKQRHCVFSYTMRCLAGTSRIVSLRWFAGAGGLGESGQELSRLTLEICPTRNAVVQIRGNLNRMATPEELKVVSHWAGVHGLGGAQKPG